MTDQQMHERLAAAGARWREHEPAVRGFDPPSRQQTRLTGKRVGWLLTAASVIAATVGIAVSLLAGGSVTQPPAEGPQSLYGTRWIYSESNVTAFDHPVVKLGKTFRRAQPSMYLRFSADGRVVGNDGCNGLAGHVRVRGDQMIVGPLGPLVSCRGALEEISNSVDELFRGTITWQISCNRLSMIDYWGELDYVAAQPHRCGSDGGTTQ